MHRDVEEGLAEVELVLVHGTRTAPTSPFEPALELHEQACPVVPVEVEVGHVALKQVAVVTGNGAPLLVPKPFEEGPRLPAQGEVPSLHASERHVLDGIEDVPAPGRVPKVGIVFFVAKLLVGGWGDDRFGVRVRGGGRRGLAVRDRGLNQGHGADDRAERARHAGARRLRELDLPGRHYSIDRTASALTSSRGSIAPSHSVVSRETLPSGSSAMAVIPPRTVVR